MLLIMIFQVFIILCLESDAYNADNGNQKEIVRQTYRSSEYTDRLKN